MCDSYVILGASSWIGHYLLPRLHESNPEAKITAICRSRQPTVVPPNTMVISPSDPAEVLEKLPPSTVIHLARGETESDFALHCRLIEIQNRKSGRYIYASSFNAVDAELSRAHRESDVAVSQSPYGQFKARCEHELLKTCRRPLAFRFAGAHGWAPNRLARTEEFLGKLRNGETFVVKSGILQNRAFVGDLAGQINLLALSSTAEGVFHLGTSDFSEEIDFRRRMARAFGYEESQVVAGENTECNAVMLTDRLREILPSNLALPTEEQTISKVRDQIELLPYVKV